MNTEIATSGFKKRTEEFNQGSEAKIKDFGGEGRVNQSDDGIGDVSGDW